MNTKIILTFMTAMFVWVSCQNEPQAPTPGPKRIESGPPDAGSGVKKAASPAEKLRAQWESTKVARENMRAVLGESREFENNWKQTDNLIIKSTDALNRLQALVNELPEKRIGETCREKNLRTVSHFVLDVCGRPGGPKHWEQVMRMPDRENVDLIWPEDKLCLATSSCPK